MKSDINTTILIEQYLENSLNDQERGVFETRMSQEPELSEQLKYQELVVKGVKHIGLQADMNAVHQHMFGAKVSWLKIVIGGILTSAIFVAIFLMSSDEQVQHQQEKRLKTTTETNLNGKAIEHNLRSGTTRQNVNSIQESGRIPKSPEELAIQEAAMHRISKQNEVAATVKNTLEGESKSLNQLLRQLFPYNGKTNTITLNAQRDTTFSLQKGTQMYVPSGAFEWADGSKVLGEITLYVDELYELNDLIALDLPTISDGQLLESGGVINIQGYKDGKELELAKSVKVKVPVALHMMKDDMRLWHGERGVDGAFNWNKGEAVKIPSSKAKKVARSEFSSVQNNVEYTSKKPSLVFEEQNETRLVPFDMSTLNYAQHFQPKKGKSSVALLQLLEALKDDQYKNTYINTVQMIDRIAGCMAYDASPEFLLKIYTNNTDKPLYEVDQMIVKALYERNFESCNIFDTPKNAEVWNAIDYFNYQVSLKYTHLVETTIQLSLNEEPSAQQLRTMESSYDLTTEELLLITKYYEDYGNAEKYIHNAKQLWLEVYGDEENVTGNLVTEFLSDCEREYYNEHYSEINQRLWSKHVYQGEIMHYLGNVKKKKLTNFDRKRKPYRKGICPKFIVYNANVKLDNVMTLLVFDDFNSFLTSSHPKGNKASFKDLPQGERVTIIVIGTDGNDYYYAIEKEVLGTSETSEMVLNKADIATIKAAMGGETEHRDLRGIAAN